MKIVKMDMLKKEICVSDFLNKKNVLDNYF